MYSVAVKIEGIESRRKSAGLLHIVTGFFLLIKAVDYYRYLEFKTFLPALPVLMVASFSLFYGFFRRKLDRSSQYNYWLRLIQVITFTFLGFVFVRVGKPIDYLGVFLFVLMSIILLFSERRIFQDTIIYLDESGIRIPGYYKDHLLNWEDLNNVVVREDFITIFNNNEKYLQYQVLQDLSTLELAKMNAFCKEQIERVGATSAS